MKKICLLALMVCLFFLLTVQAQADGQSYYLSGLEIFKGIDIGPVRYGTTFVGEVINQSDNSTIGTWYIVLNYKGSQFVGVCGGTNSVIQATLTLKFKTGKTLVLGWQDKDGWPIDWGWNDALCTVIGGSGCSCPSSDYSLPNDQAPNCSAGGESNLAYISELPLLTQWWGTSRGISVKGANLSGWLCHTYPVVPRVTGLLDIY